MTFRVIIQFGKKDRQNVMQIVSEKIGQEIKKAISENRKNGAFEDKSTGQVVYLDWGEAVAIEVSSFED